MATYLIDVTQEKIDASEGSRDGGSCPVAQAAQDVIPRFQWVTKTHIEYGSHAGENSIALPADAMERINKYDNTGEMEPFSFEVEI